MKPAMRIYKIASIFAVAGLVVVLGQQRVARPEPALGKPLQGKNAGVGVGTKHGVDAALKLYKAGGNAVDAGVAATLAGSIVEYSHFGFGGEAPILIRTKDGKVVSLAGIGTMPKMASADWFRKRKPEQSELDEVDPREPEGVGPFIPGVGVTPALVPGMVEAVLVALREYGTKSVADVLAPAIELADGAPVDEMRALTLQASRKFLSAWPTSKAVFLPNNGAPPKEGEIFHQPNLAKTLRAMVAAEAAAKAKGANRVQGIDAVRDYFYRGEIAKKIDAFMKVNGGLLRYEDMAAFRVTPEAPAQTNYRGYTIYKPSFWGQGPSMLETANMLEGVDMKGLGHNSPAYVHQFVETLKLAYADRDTYYGDPKFNKNFPFDRLLTKDYASARRKLIGDKASSDFRPGLEAKYGHHPVEDHIAMRRIDDALFAKDTTAMATMDKDGVMFVATPSGAWMPSVIAGDTGIPLGQRAQSFLLVAGHPNELAGGKRPRVTLSPTLVTRDGKPAMLLSTPGGDNQEQSLFQVFLNLTEFGMNAAEAVEAPRFQTRHLVASFDNHAVGRNELLLDERYKRETMSELAQKGHKIFINGRWNSGASPVVVRMLPNGTIEAASDPYGRVAAGAY
jgi:gamma-glutamyltranspeptidase / glutathione hydrolase